MSIIFPYFFAVSRWVCALLSLLLIALWVRYFKSLNFKQEILAALQTVDGVHIDIFLKENIIGRTKCADILLPLAGVHKRHAVLYVENRRWMLAPADGKVSVNLQNLSRPAPVEYGDKITIAGQTLTFKNRAVEDIVSKKPHGAGLPLFLLTLFQMLIGAAVCLRYFDTLSPFVPACFGGLIVGQWVYYLVGRGFRRFTMLAELPVLYLSTLGLAVCCCTTPDELSKQALCYVLGFAGFIVFFLFLKSGCNKLLLQRIAMAASVLVLYFTALFGVEINSSTNWLRIGGMTLQPSELCKVAFVFAGACALSSIVLHPKRQWEFLCFSLLCMGALAMMLDFGAVAIFFVGMLVILLLRLMNPLVVGGIFAAFAAGGVAVLYLYPYIARRFSVWMHAWEHAGGSGYQQTRTMIAAASGGLLGVGGGNGHLSDIAAAETDLVFGIVSEEWGGIAALTAALCLVALGLYAWRLARSADSLFYTIAVSASGIMLLFQSALNIFGSLDLLPLTGVTLIFVSRGGTSVLSAWLMLAFFKAAELTHRPIESWRCEQE